MKYRVTLVRTVYEFTTTFVDASNQAEAKDLAMFEAEGSLVKWYDNDSLIEVTGIEEV